jgi:predicted DCC family thiol-disulfide oxidoreductase YuxK
MAPDSHELTVYYDGSCALCRAEIGHYRKQDGADAICFRDVSDETVALEPDITRQQVMQRFHVRHADGSLTSGAEAFTGIWRMLPRWRWASRVAALPEYCQSWNSVTARFCRSGRRSRACSMRIAALSPTS